MVMRGEFGGMRRSRRVLRNTYFLSTAVLMEARFISGFWSWKESSKMAQLGPEHGYILSINSLCCVAEVSGDPCSNPATS